MGEIEIKKKELAKIESQLDKTRTSVMDDGWQTNKFAKKSRNWDILAQQKFKLQGEIEELEEQYYQGMINSIFCIECSAIDAFQCSCEDSFND